MLATHDNKSDASGGNVFLNLLSAVEGVDSPRRANLIVRGLFGPSLVGEHMNQKQFVTLLLALIIPLCAHAQGSRTIRHQTQTLEGTVVALAGVSRWAGITVESGGRRYEIQLKNFDFPNSGPKVIGGNVMEIGTRVRVLYTSVKSWNDGTLSLNATRVIKLDGQAVTQRNSQQASSQSGNWNTFWNAFRGAVRKRDRVALKGMMTVEFNTLGGVSYPSPDDERATVLRDINWNHLDEALRKGVGPLQKARGKTIRQAPPLLKDVGMVAIFEISSDRRWRWSDWYFFH